MMGQFELNVFSSDSLGRLARRRTVRLPSREVLADYA
jgi:hypothetical protein